MYVGPISKELVSGAKDIGTVTLIIYHGCPPYTNRVCVVTIMKFVITTVKTISFLTYGSQSKSIAGGSSRVTPWLSVGCVVS